MLNLCRVKMRDQQRLAHGPLSEYPNESSADDVPRRGTRRAAASRAAALSCKPGGPNDYLYMIIQPQIWEALLTNDRADRADRQSELRDPRGAVSRISTEVFGMVEEWTLTRTKWEAFDELNAINVPCGPIMDTKELLEDEDLGRAG